MPVMTDQDNSQAVEHETAYVDPASISLYINDLIVGMLETGRTDIRIEPGHRFPYFGCYTGTVVKVAYRQLVNRLKAMTETMALEPQEDDAEGHFMVIIGPENAPQHIRFNVEVGAANSHLTLRIERD